MTFSGKPKAGVALLSAQWFLSVGLQGGATARQAELAAMVEGDIGRVLGVLEKHFELLYPGPISSKEAADRAARRFRAEGAELVLLVHVMWSEDGPLLRLIRELGGLPLLVWCYNPYARLPDRLTTQELFRASGPVGFLQASAPLRRLGVEFAYVFGHPGDARLNTELSEYARAFAVTAALKGLRIAQIGPRCEAMAGTWVEELRLSAQLGASIVPVSAHRLAQEAAGIGSQLVAGFINDLKERYRVLGVSDRSLEHAARASLAVGTVAEREGCEAVAIEDLDPELHHLLKTRPCLWVPGLRERGVVVGMENDVLATLGMWFVRRLGESTPMYTEIFTFDQEANCLLLGHAGMLDPELAGANEVTLIPDAEYEASDEVEGAWLHFSARPGPVTAVNLFAAAGAYRLTCFRGEALPVTDKLAGFAHALVQVETPLEKFFERAGGLGMTQHFALSYDGIGGRLAKLCRILKLEYAEL